MLQIKKPEGRAESGDGGSIELDFAWLLFMGIQMGFSEKEIAHMYIGKWMDLFEHFKWFHNFKAKKALFTDNQPASLMDL